MKMFVANTTRQQHDFAYRVPEVNGYRRQMVPIGGQVQISGDLSQHEVDYIVAQHAPYGLVKIDEIDRTKPYIGLCYSVDKPVPVEKIRIALAHNNDVLNDRGRKLREEAAVAVNNAVEDQAPGALKSLEMTVVEETKDGSEPEVNEGIVIDRSFTQDERANRAARAARRGRA